MFRVCDMGRASYALVPGAVGSGGRALSFRYPMYSRLAIGSKNMGPRLRAAPYAYDLDAQLDAARPFVPS